MVKSFLYTCALAGLVACGVIGLFVLFHYGGVKLYLSLVAAASFVAVWSAIHGAMSHR